MCGIVAVMGKPNTKLMSVFELLLSVSVTRGRDSTGVAAINGDTPLIVKDAVWPLTLIRSSSYEEKIIKNAHKSHLYIGHNRSATVGGVTKQNAHPFRHEHITLVHNGTLKSAFTEDKKKFATDSQSIAYAISAEGIDWTWGGLDGAASLVWHDRENNTVNFITNGERPLFFGTTKGDRLLLIASESWMIRETCSAFGMKLRKDKVYFPENNVLFSYSFSPKQDKVKETEVRTIKALKKLGIYGKGTLDYERWKDPKKDYTPPLTPISPSYDKPLTEEEFDKNYWFCTICSNALDYATAIVIDDNIAACGNCTTEDQLAELRNKLILGGI